MFEISIWVFYIRNIRSGLIIGRCFLIFLFKLEKIMNCFDCI